MKCTRNGKTNFGVYEKSVTPKAHEQDQQGLELFNYYSDNNERTG